MYRLGAVALRKGKIVGKGFNSTKTHASLWSDYEFYSCHAEVRAVIKSNKYCERVIVVRVDKSNKLTCAKPCDKCMRYMKDNNIKEVYYSDWDSSMVRLVL